jgi:GntR family transcriptional regulator, N-acetylglucosamine utilization regulator
VVAGDGAVTGARRPSAGGLVRVDRRRPEPLWHQVERSIRASIDSGRWEPGARIPAEGELTTMLGVSRITVRHALANLEAAGVLRRDHGRGTFVRTTRLVAGTRALTSFSEEMAALGLAISTRVLDFRRVRATAAVAAALEIAPGTPVVRVRRLRLGGQQPIGVQSAHLRADRVDGLAAVDLGEGSLYGVLRERFGITPAWAEEVFRVAGASARDAAVLGIEPGDAVFVVERLTSDDSGPFELTMSTMRGDRYEIRSSLRAP